MEQKQEQQQPVKFTEAIGSTTYEVSIHFSKTSKETLNDKIFRLIKNDTGKQ
ncbi:transposon-encoded TnpW family protein [Sporolactobacillus sp. CPB3-1]|uniref:Transposon-encoded TnpW family protein n=1 Tax=Sporolactobacillus mangiferae TaxID=2940498 RepID=A0ABT0ME99_9BACL|nr:transposon-encoded TnpW family protein [Sporolactobacillus mangiferae]MCL1632923.1 transposon-encoded TnpW family protein [Sporolactobacillus mangiferae]